MAFAEPHPACDTTTRAVFPRFDLPRHRIRGSITTGDVRWRGGISGGFSWSDYDYRGSCLRRPKPRNEAISVATRHTVVSEPISNTGNTHVAIQRPGAARDGTRAGPAPGATPAPPPRGGRGAYPRRAMTTIWTTARCVAANWTPRTGGSSRAIAGTRFAPGAGTSSWNARWRATRTGGVPRAARSTTKARFGSLRHPTPSSPRRASGCV